MFEKYGFEGVNVSIQAVLTLYAQVPPCLQQCEAAFFFVSKLLEV